MKTGILAIALLVGSSAALPVYGQVEQDLKDAGKSTKDAAETGTKKAAKGTKKGAEKAGHETKKGAETVGKETKKGTHKAADKVADKTDDTSKN